MIDGVIHPAFLLLAGAFLIGLTRGHLRSAVLFAAPVATLWALWQIPDGVVATAYFLGYEIQPIEGSAVRRLFATIFTIMAFTGGLFAFRQAKWYELAAGYAYAAGAVGVSFAGAFLPSFAPLPSFFLLLLRHPPFHSSLSFSYFLVFVCLSFLSLSLLLSSFSSFSSSSYLSSSSCCCSES